jgi:hypothetical protein
VVQLVNINIWQVYTYPKNDTLYIKTGSYRRSNQIEIEKGIPTILWKAFVWVVEGDRIEIEKDFCTAEMKPDAIPLFIQLLTKDFHWITTNGSWISPFTLSH